MAREMGFDEELAARKPFPALGLGARIVGEVTRERLDALRAAERIFRDEVQEAGFERRLYKYFPILSSYGEDGREMRKRFHAPSTRRSARCSTFSCR